MLVSVDSLSLRHRTDSFVAINYRLKSEDIAYIFDHADVDAILVDAEFKHLLDGFQIEHPNIPLLIDTDTDNSEGPLAGPYDNAILEGLEYDKATGSQGWDGLETLAPDEEAVIALAYTSGTTARPKGVEYTHRGAYMGAMGNVIESGLNYHKGRCRYLWTLPMFHAMGMNFVQAPTIDH
jgi:acyl-CoA synthetase (AMP-forming)/AMP-acid ligase II